MTILIAPDSFKGSLDAWTAARIIRDTLHRARPDVTSVVKPMADGGEGTARAMIEALDGAWEPCKVMGPLPDMRVDAGYAWFAEEETALVEMAAASGLTLLEPRDRDPLLTTTYGTGELIRAAAERGARRILLAVGGSATNDGGLGAAMALGWRFYDDEDMPLRHGGGALQRLAAIDGSDAVPLPPVQVLCDVNNPLFGAQGAAAVYGPQKGAHAETVNRLDAGLMHFTAVVRDQLGIEVNVPGAGAGGGLPAGALAFMGGTLVSGIQTLMDITGIDEVLDRADYVITGEGCFDAQSLSGKVVSGILTRAGPRGVRIAVLCGTCRLDEAAWRDAGIDTVIPVTPEDMPLAQAVRDAPDLLSQAVLRFAAKCLQP